MRVTSDKVCLQVQNPPNPTIKPNLVEIEFRQTIQSRKKKSEFALALSDLDFQLILV
jgi:hypothetical protein